MQRHRFDPLSLIPGVVFVAVGIAALSGTIRIQTIAWDWVWPITLLVIGALLVPTGFRSREAAPDETAERAEPTARDGADAGDAADPALVAAHDELPPPPDVDRD